MILVASTSFRWAYKPRTQLSTAFSDLDKGTLCAMKLLGRSMSSFCENALVRCLESEQGHDYKWVLLYCYMSTIFRSAFCTYDNESKQDELSLNEKVDNSMYACHSVRRATTRTQVSVYSYRRLHGGNWKKFRAPEKRRQKTNVCHRGILKCRTMMHENCGGAHPNWLIKATQHSNQTNPQ